MPELPEVQTTASGLDRVARGLVITDVWTEYNSPYYHGADNIKDPEYFRYFKKKVKGAKITHVTRRAKNILIHLSNDFTILIHMKMTGHVMYGDYNKTDPFNRHIRLIFYLSNGKTMELCDTRKFAKVTLLSRETMYESIHLKGIGPEPLEDNFTFTKFKEQLSRKPNGKIKIVLLDQSVIAGIGNIYSDESLWRAGIHPEEPVRNLFKDKNEKLLKELYKAIRSTLSKGIDFGGDSMSDYRNIHGERGKFQEEHMAYRKTGSKCMKKGCTGIIERIVVGGRSTHFCNVHQKRLSK
jgi:formamidopyrimidine-DNA glycosylase